MIINRKLLRIGFAEGENFSNNFLQFLKLV